MSSMIERSVNVRPSNKILLTREEYMHYVCRPPLAALARHCPLNSHMRTFSMENATSLGTLDVLPLETKRMLLIHANLASLFAFRIVNKRAWNLVESLLEWQCVCLYHASSRPDEDLSLIIVHSENSTADCSPSYRPAHNTRIHTRPTLHSTEFRYPRLHIASQLHTAFGA